WRRPIPGDAVCAGSRSSRAVGVERTAIFGSKSTRVGRSVTRCARRIAFLQSANYSSRHQTVEFKGYPKGPNYFTGFRTRKRRGRTDVHRRRRQPGQKYLRIHTELRTTGTNTRWRDRPAQRSLFARGNPLDLADRESS